MRATNRILLLIAIIALAGAAAFVYRSGRAGAGEPVRMDAHALEALPASA